MKKQILFLAATVITTLSFAQQKISFGLKAGLTQSGLRGEANNNLQDLIEFSNGMIRTTDRTAFFAGSYVTIPAGNLLSIEPGIYYSQKGYVLKGELDGKGISFLGMNAKAQLNTHYIDMPLLLKARMGGLQIFAGPQLSYLAKADFKTTAGALGFNVYNNQADATDQLNRWDAAITGGLGYQLDNGLNVSASYDYGLSKADADKRMDSYNRSVKIGVGYSF